MPVCFELIDRSTGEIVPPVEVDNRMRVAMGFDPDPENWLDNWYNCFGLSLACGDSWERIKEDWAFLPVKFGVIEYLSSIYEVHCWRE